MKGNVYGSIRMIRNTDGYLPFYSRLVTHVVADLTYLWLLKSH